MTERENATQIVRAYLELTVKAAQKALEAMDRGDYTDFDLAVLTQTVEGNAHRADHHAVFLLNHPELSKVAS